MSYCESQCYPERKWENVNKSEYLLVLVNLFIYMLAVIIIIIIIII